MFPIPLQKFEFPNFDNKSIKSLHLFHLPKSQKLYSLAFKNQIYYCKS